MALFSLKSESLDSNGNVKEIEDSREESIRRCRTKRLSDASENQPSTPLQGFRYNETSTPFTINEKVSFSEDKNTMHNIPARRTSSNGVGKKGIQASIETKTPDKQNKNLRLSGDSVIRNKRKLSNLSTNIPNMSTEVFQKSDLHREYLSKSGKLETYELKETLSSPPNIKIAHREAKLRARIDLRNQRKSTCVKRLFDDSSDLRAKTPCIEDMKNFVRNSGIFNSC